MEKKCRQQIQCFRNKFGQRLSLYHFHARIASEMTEFGFWWSNSNAIDLEFHNVTFHFFLVLFLLRCDLIIIKIIMNAWRPSNCASNCRTSAGAYEMLNINMNWHINMNSLFSTQKKNSIFQRCELVKRHCKLNNEQTIINYGI